ncbi:MAG: Rne/Rng family ribonuclease [Aquiluna sp.]|nr:Rne/Rng family ribonuclease [Aquiluna sp.]
MAKKKEEPKKPLSTQLIFQAPDLPTPKVNPRSGKLADDEEGDAPRKPLAPRTRTRTKSDAAPAAKKAEPATEEKETGSTRVAAKKQRRNSSRDSGRRRTAVTESEFLARRESVDRRMVVREKDERVQIGVLEDGLLVEHYVAESQGGSLIGNVYLGKVQNVLPSMEAAFVDIGRGRNAVLYSGEVDWEAAETGNQPRRIELALKSGDQVLVQVTKDPVGQKGARLTSQISLPGRFLVYVPGGNMSGISRKLPEGERQRLKQILKHALPEDAGVIVRTAAEGATEDQLTLDVERLKAQWEQINAVVAMGKAPTLLHSEPDLLVKIIRDVFNEDFAELVIAGDESHETISKYLESVAPELLERIVQHKSDEDIFDTYKLGDQIIKALDRKVFLPSGGSLVIDRTEAMTVVDVNTGKFIGSGGNLEETVTKNNLEAAEELVRQLRLRDIGGIVVVDFIDMIQESNQEMVRRRLLECLSRDRTKNQVGEVTSLGLVQLTRKKIGLGLLETFSEPCDCCAGRGVVVHDEPRFKMPESSEPKRGKRKERTKSQAEPQIVKKIVTAEQADAFKSVVNQIAAAGHSEDSASAPEVKEPEGKTEILNAVLDSLPEPELVAKPKRRRATSAGKAIDTKN